MEPSLRLRDTTLGDVLAALHRRRASCVLELDEPRAQHVIHLRGGEVLAVESGLDDDRVGDLVVSLGVATRALVEDAWACRKPLQRIGHCLVGMRVITSRQRDQVLDAQRLHRLEALYAVPDATLRVRDAAALPEGAAEQRPLPPRQAFFGRPRRRDGGAVRIPWTLAQCEALAVLGLGPTASRDEARRAFRQRVVALHPDRDPGARDEARTARLEALLRVLDAWQVIARAS